MHPKQSLKFIPLAAFVLLASGLVSPPAHAEDCHFGHDTCHAGRFGHLWVETFDLTHDGRPTTFHAGEVIARINQHADGYAGFRLKRVGFLVARDSLSRPRIGVFVNDQRVGERSVDSHGNVFTGYNAEPVAVDVDDCPLDFYAIVQKGSVETYAVNFYWEDPRGDDWDDFSYFGSGDTHITIGHNPGEHREPYGPDLAEVTDRLAFNIERIRDFMTPDQYQGSVEPMLAPARKMHADIRACGAICAQPTAVSIVTLESGADNILQGLLTAPATSRFADGILTNVERIRAYYELGTTEKK